MRFFDFPMILSLSSYIFIAHHKVQQENIPMLIHKALYIVVLFYLYQFKFLLTLSKFPFYFCFLYFDYFLWIYLHNHYHHSLVNISIKLEQIFRYCFTTFQSPNTQQIINFIKYVKSLMKFIIEPRTDSQTDDIF